MKKLLVSFLLFASCGCAPLLTGTAADVSSLITLGGFGQTVVQLTSAGPRKLPVGALPVQYAGDADRMTREAWEQNYQIAKIAQWAGEDLPWQDLAASVARKAGTTRVVFALVAKQTSHMEQRREDITVYRTLTGKTVADPADSFGEAYYPENRAVGQAVPVFRYTAWFFTKSRQPSGILATPEAWGGPCKNAARSGTLVRAVGKNTPAHKASIQSGDVITSINGQLSPYQKLFSLLTPGENTVALCRNGQTMTTVVRLPVPRGAAVQPGK